jgi:hypothetical protein
MYTIHCTHFFTSFSPQNSHYSTEFDNPDFTRWFDFPSPNTTLLKHTAAPDPASGQITIFPYFSGGHHRPSLVTQETPHGSSRHLVHRSVG